MWHKNAGRENAGLQNTAQEILGCKMRVYTRAVVIARDARFYSGVVEYVALFLGAADAHATIHACNVSLSILGHALEVTREHEQVLHSVCIVQPYFLFPLFPFLHFPDLHFHVSHFQRPQPADMKWIG